MLTIEPPLYQFPGAIVFRDHVDPDQFYLLPSIPKVSSFMLMKYRPGLTDDPARTWGAGFAWLDVMIPAGDVGQLQSEVATESGRANARLSPVVFRDGRAHVIFGRTADDRLIEDLVGTTVVSPAPPHAATFALTLGAEGTALLEHAAAGEQVPAAVAYELRFSAVTPALHGRVSIDCERVYDQLAASSSSPYWQQAQIDLALESLVDLDAIKINVTGSPAADWRRQRTLMMDLVKARIQRDFFRAGIPPEPEEGMAGALPGLLKNLLGLEVASASALFVLKPRAERVRAQKTLEMTYGGPAGVDLTHLCTAGLSLPADGNVAPIVRDVDIDPFFSMLDVRVSSGIDFEELADLQMVVVDLVHGQTAQSLLFRKDASAPRSFQALLTNPLDDEYQYTVEYHFDPASTDGPAVIKAGPYHSRDRALVIDPRAHMQYRRVQVVLGPLDLAAIPTLRVHLRSPGESGQPDSQTLLTLDLDRKHPSGLWRRRLPMRSSRPRVFARVAWLAPDFNTGELDEIEIIDDVFVVNGPALLSVRVIPVVDWAAVDKMIVDVHYKAGHYRRSLFFSREAAAPTVLQIPALDPQRRTYEWRQMLLGLDGTLTETIWALTDRTELVVGRPGPLTHEVRVIWVRPSGPAHHVLVDFFVKTSSGEDQNLVVLLSPEDSAKTIVLPLDPEGRKRYRYEVRMLTPAGQELLPPPWGETDESTVLVVTPVA